MTQAATSNATSAETSYHLIPTEHWSTPSNISRSRYHDSLDYLGSLGVGKGSLISYRHMCRWNSGFFFQHPALQDYRYYWRVEPDVHFFCHIPYDPFSFIHENSIVYGFNMAILEDARSFPSLWRTTLAFTHAHPEMLHPDADLSWLVDDDEGGTYANCQFFSNFEIGSLDFFRSEASKKYFEWLDDSGGFYYERFGDAPIHTLAVALFAARNQVWFFRDIGYQHDSARHCPAEYLRGRASPLEGHGRKAAQRHHVGQIGRQTSGREAGRGGGERCACEPTPLDENFYRLVPMESPQRKPADTCVRLWLGGEWLSKRDGWKRDIEVQLGGDGYGGYERG
ncbi:uncharacterized protein HMPREF1541_09500 [Cyphellophora europaea CBS 101466]|uniref:Uncharacterized protein n=1 Tax=Cyphellophora europaea (strain CBS 101466) TaxID=1220924 RepID=W2SAE0_CYPE1|nr:uncharacterized protein HMPREF1541_09500 [Cyphellophora europaea CBS 101466]ETN45667.1 hypothetical protein HMPREF1541_09500 [Cyphellophora europaea CBS 101466]